MLRLTIAWTYDIQPTEPLFAWLLGVLQPSYRHITRKVSKPHDLMLTLYLLYLSTASNVCPTCRISLDLFFPASLLDVLVRHCIIWLTNQSQVFHICVNRLYHHWLRYWLIACSYQALIWTNAHLLYKWILNKLQLKYMNISNTLQQFSLKKNSSQIPSRQWYLFWIKSIVSPNQSTRQS